MEWILSICAVTLAACVWSLLFLLRSSGKRERILEKTTVKAIAIYAKQSASDQAKKRSIEEKLHSATVALLDSDEKIEALETENSRLKKSIDDTIDVNTGDHAG